MADWTAEGLEKARRERNDLLFLSSPGRAGPLLDGPGRRSGAVGLLPGRRERCPSL